MYVPRSAFVNDATKKTPLQVVEDAVREILAPYPEWGQVVGRAQSVWVIDLPGFSREVEIVEGQNFSCNLIVFIRVWQAGHKTDFTIDQFREWVSQHSAEWETRVQEKPKQEADFAPVLPPRKDVAVGASIQLSSVDVNVLKAIRDRIDGNGRADDPTYDPRVDRDFLFYLLAYLIPSREADIAGRAKALGEMVSSLSPSGQDLCRKVCSDIEYLLRKVVK